MSNTLQLFLNSLAGYFLANAGCGVDLSAFGF